MSTNIYCRLIYCFVSDIITFMPKIQLILHTQDEISTAEIMLGLAPPFQATSCIPSFEATNIIILYIYFYCHIAPIFSPIFAPKLVFSAQKVKY